MTLVWLHSYHRHWTQPSLRMRATPPAGNNLGGADDVNGYERIVTAIKRKEPDRVPIMEWFIHDNVIRGMCPDCKDVMDLVERFDLDGIGVGGKHVPKHSQSSEKFVYDQWGTKFARTAEAYVPYEGPIKSEADLEKYIPPNPNDESMVADVKAAAKRFKGKKFIAYLTRSDFMSAADIRGLPNLLMDFIENPKLAHGVLTIINEYYCTLARRAVEAGADGVVIADDWAFNTGPFMSPKQFKEFVLPYYQRAVKTIQDAGGYAIKHTDGNIWPIIDMTVDAGIDVLNPLQPDSGMDLGEVKKRYGHRVCLAGNINCGYTLSEAPLEQVVREVKEAIRVAGPGGGYIMMSSNSLHSSVRAENYRIMVETTQKLGRYPLDMNALR